MSDFGVRYAHMPVFWNLNARAVSLFSLCLALLSSLLRSNA